MLGGVSDVIEEAVTEECELVAFEEFELDLGKRGVFVDNEHTGAVGPLTVLIETSEGEGVASGREVHAGGSQVGNVG